MVMNNFMLQKGGDVNTAQWLSDKPWQDPVQSRGFEEAESDEIIDELETYTTPS
jgi:hypothetical protein